MGKMRIKRGLIISGVNANIFLGAIEAPRGGVWGGGTVPSPENFFDFGSQNADLWCIFVAVFAVQLKLLGGEKILAQVYFYLGGNRTLAPPGSTPLLII